MDLDVAALSLLILLSFIPSLFWLFFYFFYSPQFTTSRGILAAVFFGGIVAALAAAFIERWGVGLLPGHTLSVLNQYFFLEPPQDPVKLGILALFTFLFIAPVEEFLKFSLLFFFIKRFPKHLNQIIDGIKFGIVVGLGFAVLENGVYFYPHLISGETATLLKIFFLRFFVATLGHSLYTGVLGYYVGLGHFYRLYRGKFIRNGLILAILIHGLFNFFLFVNIGFYSVILVIVSLLFMVKWYRDRKNLESYIVQGKYEMIRPPMFAERPEFESILAKNRVTYAVIKKFRLCPFCLKGRDPKQETCLYCGKRVKQD